MEFDLGKVGAATANRLMTSLVTPRPIAWIVTCDAQGRRNAAPFSFFNVLCSWPPILAVGIQPRPEGPLKDTRANIEATGEFVVNLVPYAAVEAMNRTSFPHPAGTDEITLAGLETLACTHVTPPRIAASPVAFECRLRQSIAIEQDRAILLGDVLAAHVDDDAVIDPARGDVDAVALDLVARMHGKGTYLRATDLFEVARPYPYRKMTNDSFGNDA